MFWDVGTQGRWGTPGLQPVRPNDPCVLRLYIISLSLPSRYFFLVINIIIIDYSNVALDSYYYHCDFYRYWRRIYSDFKTLLTT